MISLYNPNMSEQLPILYSFRRCPYAIRARLALRYAGLNCELREVQLRDKPAEMLAASPKGTVPVLLVPRAGGMNECTYEVIDESLEIALWALAQHDPDGWLDVDFTAANRLIMGNDEEFKVWLDRYKYPDRFSSTDQSDPLQQCCRFLDVLERRLGRHKMLMCDSLSFVDMAIFPFIRQFAFVDRERFQALPYPLLNDWLTRILNMDLFAAVMEKYPLWRPDNNKLIF